MSTAIARPFPLEFLLPLIVLIAAIEREKLSKAARNDNVGLIKRARATAKP
jgi:hypothetical protein